VDTCRAAGLTPTRVLECPEDEYAPALRELLSQNQRPTAFVTYNDDWALRVINLARTMQFQIPRDLSVVGFDDSPAARNHAVSITSVCPECREIGVSAVNVLVDKIDNPRKRATYNLRITPRLVVRESTGKPPKDG
jgi:DNA-binding LacI/PurR family transcriptional regulator